jgi:hypothetical protein
LHLLCRENLAYDLRNSPQVAASRDERADVDDLGAAVFPEDRLQRFARLL